MRVGIVLCVGVFVVACGAPAEPSIEATAAEPIATPGAIGYELVFEDEFDGAELDGERWGTCFWWSTDGGCTIASNDELEWYQPANVALEESTARLTARRQDVVNAEGVEFPYTSGMISTGPAVSRGEPRFAFRYGYLEARIQVPRAVGLWPVFWLLPPTNQSRPEIDVMEIVGEETTVNRVHIHWLDGEERRSSGGEFRGPDFADDWHTFGLMWTEDRLIWTVDGQTTHSYTGRGVPTEPLYVLLNLAVGGVYPGSPDDDSDFPATLRVDWVRVWQNESGTRIGSGR